MSMREIKFRQFIGGKMVYWGFIDGAFFSPSANGATSENAQNTPHMQYTGLHDSKGKEIYEGDLLQLVPNGTEPGAILEVYWEQEMAASYLRVGDRWNNLLEGYTKEHHIVGNIYENPELPEKQ